MPAFLLQLSEDVVLIRAIRDSNLPKFMEEDVVLFEGIVGDLFPNVAITDQACRLFMSFICCGCRFVHLYVPHCLFTRNPACQVHMRTHMSCFAYAR